MLEPIPFWGMIEVDLPVKTYSGDRPNYILTDEEILDCHDSMTNGANWVIDFARAILKKAQEK